MDGQSYGCTVASAGNKRTLPVSLTDRRSIPSHRHTPQFDGRRPHRPDHVVTPDIERRRAARVVVREPSRVSLDRFLARWVVRSRRPTRTPCSETRATHDGVRVQGSKPQYNASVVICMIRALAYAWRLSARSPWWLRSGRRSVQACANPSDGLHE